MMSGHYWLTKEQMERLRQFFPKSRGKPRVDDRRVLSGIIYIKKNGLQWKDAPSVYGPPKTLCLPGSSHNWRNLVRTARSS
jgi:transposase